MRGRFSESICRGGALLQPPHSPLVRSTNIIFGTRRLPPAEVISWVSVL